MTDDIVEKVAKVIADILHACGRLDDSYTSPWTAGPCLLAAQAAIAACADHFRADGARRMQEAAARSAALFFRGDVAAGLIRDLDAEVIARGEGR